MRNQSQFQRAISVAGTPARARRPTVGALPLLAAHAATLFGTHPDFFFGTPPSSGSADWIPVRTAAQACVRHLMDSFIAPSVPPAYSGSFPPGSPEYNWHALQIAAYYAYNVLAHLGSGLRPGESPHVLSPSPRLALCPSGPVGDLLPATWMYHTTEDGWNVLNSAFAVASCLSKSLSGSATDLSTAADALARCLYPLFAFMPARLI